MTQISINDHRTLLVTCGADRTIFMYQLILGTPFTLDRLGYVETPNSIAYITWKPDEVGFVLLKISLLLYEFFLEIYLTVGR